MKGSGASGNFSRAAPRSPPCGSGAVFARGTMAVVLALLALLIEIALGYPDWLVRSIGHPVTWMGRLIGLMDRRLNRAGASEAHRRAAGIVAVLLLVAVAGSLAYALAL